MMYMPSSSQARSRAGLMGLWAERMALKPKLFMMATFLRATSSYSRAPKMPLSWCMQPPRRSSGLPLMSRPSCPFHAMVRMPKVSVRVSTTLPSFRSSTHASYSVGLAALQSWALGMTISAWSPSALATSTPFSRIAVRTVPPSWSMFKAMMAGSMPLVKTFTCRM